MIETLTQPQNNTIQLTLAQTEALLTDLSAPPLAKTPNNTDAYTIPGDKHSIRYFVEQTDEGEKLVLASVNVSVPKSSQPCILTLSPFPQGNTGEAILSLLQDANLKGSIAEDLLPALEELGKQANGIGWKPALSLPLEKRPYLKPMTYVSPSLEEIINNDPSIGTVFASSRSTNGTYDLCTAKLNLDDESVTFTFYRSENDQPLKQLRELVYSTPPALRSATASVGSPAYKSLIRKAEEVQTHFHDVGTEFAISRFGGYGIPSDGPVSLPPNVSTDDKIRMMVPTGSRPIFSHTFTSGAVINVEEGDEVVSLTLKSSNRAPASEYIALIDRAGLDLFDGNWNTRKDAFIEAAKKLVVESDDSQVAALHEISRLATKQVDRPAAIKYLLDLGSAMSLFGLADNYGLQIRTDVGHTPQEIQRLCDGSEVLVISHPIERLGNNNLSVFQQVALEFKANGELAFTAHNLSGNQVSGKVSKAGAAAAGGTIPVALNLARGFAKQFDHMERHPFSAAVEDAVALDPADSSCQLSGQFPHLDLPQPQDKAGNMAFDLAEECAREACAHADGYGKHQVAALAPGRAEARLQFPNAPYDMIVHISGEEVVQVDFIPKSSAANSGSPLYSFAGGFSLANGDVGAIESLLKDFAEWGKEHSRPGTAKKPLEETEAFAGFRRMLPTEGPIH